MVSIREQIIRRIMVVLPYIQTAAKYNFNYTTIGRGRIQYDRTELPVLAVLPGVESTTGMRAGQRENTMEVQIRAYQALTNTVNPSERAEKMLSDIIMVVMGVWITVRFINGSHEIKVGDRITGALSGADGYVFGVNVTSGSWAGGDAAGSLNTYYPRNLPYTPNEDLKVGATICAKLISTPVLVEKYINSVSRVDYIGGGVESYPETGEGIIEVVTRFNFVYTTQNDNPYV